MNGATKNMPRRWRSESEYPENWAEIAAQVKEECGGKCERCNHEHDSKAGYCFTVHHLDGNKANCKRWNLAGLCQRCHLYMQPVCIDQLLFDFVTVSEWFKPHLDGYKKERFKC